MRRHGSRWASKCALGTPIQWDTHGCRDTRAENSGRLTATMEILFFQTPTLISLVRSRSMFIPCDLLAENCGGTKPHCRIPSTWTCGMTTSTQPDPVPSSEALVALPQVPRDKGGPVFAEPWQAQAFALAVKLSELGHFTWKEWAAALAEELKSAADRGEPDDGSHYYEHWLATLERLISAKGLSDPATMLARKEAWADAYRHTPHGKPVELAAAKRETNQP